MSAPTAWPAPSLEILTLLVHTSSSGPERQGQGLVRIIYSSLEGIDGGTDRGNCDGPSLTHKLAPLSSSGSELEGSNRCSPRQSFVWVVYSICFFLAASGGRVFSPRAPPRGPPGICLHGCYKSSTCVPTFMMIISSTGTSLWSFSLRLQSPGTSLFYAPVRHHCPPDTRPALGWPKSQTITSREVLP